MTLRFFPTHLLALLLAALCAGCSDGVDGRGGTPDGSDTPLRADPAALQPASISVHALTRVGIDPSGNPALICHIEFLDQFGQSVKALGRVRVELFRPESDTGGGGAGGGGAATVQVQDLVWNLDLSDPQANATHFDDLITRTYTLSLGGLPDWLVAWSRGESAGGSGGIAPSIRASFTFADVDGSQRTLSAAFRLVR